MDHLNHHHESAHSASTTSPTASASASTALAVPAHVPRPLNPHERDLLAQLDRLKLFLASAPSRWANGNNNHSPSTVHHPALNRFLLPSGEYVSCVLWNGLYHITGTDIVRALVFRFEAFGRPITNMKKFEEGIFSDLRNLKPGSDASLEEPKSPFLDLLFKYQCIRTQKKQKVFYWFSVPHDRLFLDALERDLKREKIGQEATTVPKGEPALSFTYDPKQSLFEQFMKNKQSDDDSSLPTFHQHQHQPSNSDNYRISVNNSVVSPADILRRRAEEAFGLNAKLDKSDEDPFHLYNNNTPSHHSAPTASTSLSAPPPSAPPINQAKQSSGSFFNSFTLFEGSPGYKQRRKKTKPKKRLITSLEEHPPSPPYASETPLAYAAGRLSAPQLHPSLAAADPRYGSSISPIVTTPPGLQQQHHHQQQQQHLGRVKAYVCPVRACRKMFRVPDHLRRHVRVHRTGEKAFPCERCNKRFSRPDILAQHLRVHASLDGQNATTDTEQPAPSTVEELENGVVSGEAELSMDLEMHAVDVEVPYGQSVQWDDELGYGSDPGSVGSAASQHHQVQQQQQQQQQHPMYLAQPAPQTGIYVVAPHHQGLSASSTTPPYVGNGEHSPFSETAQSANAAWMRTQAYGGGPSSAPPGYGHLLSPQVNSGRLSAGGLQIGIPPPGILPRSAPSSAPPHKVSFDHQLAVGGLSPVGLIHPPNNGIPPQYGVPTNVPSGYPLSMSGGGGSNIGRHHSASPSVPTSGVPPPPGTAESVLSAQLSSRSSPGSYAIQPQQQQPHQSPVGDGSPNQLLLAHPMANYQQQQQPSQQQYMNQYDGHSHQQQHQQHQGGYYAPHPHSPSSDSGLGYGQSSGAEFGYHPHLQQQPQPQGQQGSGQLGDGDVGVGRVYQYEGYPAGGAVVGSYPYGPQSSVSM